MFITVRRMALFLGIAHGFILLHYGLRTFAQHGEKVENSIWGEGHISVQEKKKKMKRCDLRTWGGAQGRQEGRFPILPHVYCVIEHREVLGQGWQTWCHRRGGREVGKVRWGKGGKRLGKVF